MAKSKAKKGPQKGAHSHLQARLDYLHKAAVYLHAAFATPSNESLHRNAIQTKPPVLDSGLPETASNMNRDIAVNVNKKATEASIPRQYLSHMRGVSLKSQLRLPLDMKRSFCKRCDLLLVQGVNCVYELRNASKGGKKPWADVLVVRCNACQTEKRFPQTSNRNRKLTDRRKETEQKGD